MATINTSEGKLCNASPPYPDFESRRRKLFVGPNAILSNLTDKGDIVPITEAVHSESRGRSMNEKPTLLLGPATRPTTSPVISSMRLTP